MNKIQAGLLPVSSIHKIYYETYGNENGVPLLCFHGGPGGGFSTRYIDMIDLEKFYVIFFDQRGCGRSTPDAEIAENTCQDAVDDAYRLLCYLNISKCVVSGYSYGSTLAMAFAEQFTEQVLSVYLSSVFIPYDFNSLFFKQHHSLPDAYEKFINIVRTTEARELLNEYEKCGFKRKQDIVAAIVNWELELFQLNNAKFCSADDVDNRLISSKRVFLHYVSNDFFDFGTKVKNNLNKLSGIPITTVQGKNDKITPISVAYGLQKFLPQLRIISMPDTGHIGRVITKRYYDEVNKLIITENGVAHG